MAEQPDLLEKKEEDITSLQLKEESDSDSESESDLVLLNDYY